MKLESHKGDNKRFRVSRQKKLQETKHKKSRKRRARRGRKHSKDNISPSIRSVLRENKDVWSKARKKVFSETFKKRSYNDIPKVITIDKPLGLEIDVKAFLDKAEEFISVESKKFTFDIRNCSRLWPSGVTLLVSMVNWCQMTSAREKWPKLLCQKPNFDSVEDYLIHCGFYKYVAPNYTFKASGKYDTSEIVKIVKETKRENQEQRHKEIFRLVKRNSSLDADGLEWFNDVILTEILANVSEHGVCKSDRFSTDYGWFNLTQLHSTHKIISICIADNGMGIKNNLVSGPQKDEISKNLKKNEDNAGRFIKKAFEANVSGAFKASTKERTNLVLKQYKRGARRGNGLKRVMDTCKMLRIPLTIVSGEGAVEINEKGVMLNPHDRKKKIFAGTLFHLRIPAK